jgi:hypothetical protein
MRVLYFLFAISGFALLPPLAQSIKEIEALVADPRFYQALGSAEAIQEITRNEHGYQIVTQHYTMQVNIEYLRTGKIGPAQFQFEFQEAVQR